MAESAGDQAVLELAKWALPIQERHFKEAQENCLQLAGEQDPNGTN